MGWWEKVFGKDEPVKKSGALIDPLRDNLNSGNPALGDLSKVMALIDAGADVNGGTSALQHAVRTNDHQLLRALLDAGGQADFNSAALKPAEPPPQPEATAGDIEIRKPLTFKKKTP